MTVSLIVLLADVGKLATVYFGAVVVIGDGEKNNAPLLHNGAHVGNGHGPACDLAVDPIDGMSLTASGQQNAISGMAVSDRRTTQARCSSRT
ncbi:hypothetical protein GCM10022222_09810 [Amycolatopsis ultiminotia]|uniref:Fructose-1,6-bisphosphatase class 2 n=1 Tax=Amycolatopsis ultiminotia TaxID=543629 RepID=A0ABP6V9D4_9PSEU